MRPNNQGNNNNIDDTKYNQTKGILQTANKNHISKTRRISWGEVKIKEFTKNEEVNNQLGEEYNVNMNSGKTSNSELSDRKEEINSNNLNILIKGNDQTKDNLGGILITKSKIND